MRNEPFRKGGTLAVVVGLGLVVGSACNPKAPEGTGGATVEEAFGPDGRSCGRGITVSMTDYESSNVALVGLDGKVLSESFVSSGSTATKLSNPLVEAVFPTSRMKTEVVILDRYPASVLTFIDPESAQVRAQISVRTGFDANPQDYLDLGDGRALVSRLEKNPRPGREAFDEGDDLLWLDIEQGAITGRIDLSSVADEGTERARPSQLVRVGDTVFLTLTGHDATFQNAAPGKVVALDAETGRILSSHVIDGTKNCVGMDVAPSEDALVVSCSDLIGAGNAAAPPFSAVVTLDFERSGDEVTFEEGFRLQASSLGLGPFTDSIAYASAGLVLVGLYGALEGEDSGRPDRVIAVDVSPVGTGAGGAGSERVEELLASEREPFSLGDIQCAEPCGVCFVADAERSVLHRYSVGTNSVGAPTTHVVETDIGLPPRGLGQF